MIALLRTNSTHPLFIELVGRLDAELTVIDGDAHEFYDQFNKIEHIKYAVVAYFDEQAAGCGAIKSYAPGVVEVKRMYTLPEHRGRGIATRILSELEAWAAELSCEKCILETGKGQPDAIALYRKRGYTVIPNYGQYAGVENSVCFEKKIKL